MTETHGPLHQFVIEPLIPLQIAGFDVSFTNSSLWMMIGVAVSVAFLSLATRRAALVPGRLQMSAEIIYQFIANMIRENVGDAGRVYFPLVFTIFMVVFMGNILGMLPFSFTYTSHIAVTGALALGIFLTVFVVGLFRHGLHFFHLFVPAGVPLWLTPLVIPIEIISFFVRPLTLSVRLFANMMAGHLILKVFAGFCVSLIGAFGALGFIGALGPMLFNCAMIALECLIAFLQAYVFTILTCIYLKDTVEISH
ncbi:MAG: F0F1 ATP synthase subunit A [Rhodospirillales bacterium]|nr:F0F1 ATP synthase subunit A [Rhodospirillales bacterium]